VEQRIYSRGVVTQKYVAYLAGALPITATPEWSRHDFLFWQCLCILVCVHLNILGWCRLSFAANSVTSIVLIDCLAPILIVGSHVILWRSVKYRVWLNELRLAADTIRRDCIIPGYGNRRSAVESLQCWVRTLLEETEKEMEEKLGKNPNVTKPIIERGVLDYNLFAYGEPNYTDKWCTRWTRLNGEDNMSTLPVLEAV
jgi:hypothetical protein